MWTANGLQDFLGIALGLLTYRLVLTGREEPGSRMSLIPADVLRYESNQRDELMNRVGLT